MHEKLTFDELSVGDSFIAFPEPGDNVGHGGYKGSHSVFKKTKPFIEDNELDQELSARKNTINIKTGIAYAIPD